MASKVEYLENRIETILKNRTDELTALRNEVTADRQRLEAADKALKAATAANDIEAYRRAKSEKELAADLINLHEGRTQMLEGKELVTEEEYKSVRDSVLDETNALLSASRAKAADLLAELQRIAESDNAIIDRANKALRKWQETIFKDPDLRANNGIFLEHKLARIKLSPVVGMMYQITERSSDYKQIMGGES